MGTLSWNEIERGWWSRLLHCDKAVNTSTFTQPLFNSRTYPVPAMVVQTRLTSKI